MKKEGGMKNKKLVFLALSVLLILTMGIIIWNLSTKSKTDSISVQCKFACETNSVYGFCSAERIVNDDLKATCKTLAENPQYAKYGVETCPTISCDHQDLDQTCVSGLGGTWEFSLADGTCSQSGTEIRRQVTPSDNPPIEGQICCT